MLKCTLVVLIIFSSLNSPFAMYSTTEEYCDGNRMHRDPGEDFQDYRGIFRTPGVDEYIDGNGMFRDPGEDFQDYRKIFRVFGEEEFMDGCGIFRKP